MTEHRMPKRVELLGVVFDLRGHDLLLTYSKYSARPFIVLVVPPVTDPPTAEPAPRARASELVPKRVQAPRVRRREEYRIARRNTLLEELRDAHMLSPFFEYGGAIEHDGELHESREEIAGQRQAPNGGVLTFGFVGVKTELGGRGRGELTGSKHRLRKLGEAGVGTATVDASHLFAGRHGEAARLQEASQGDPRLTRAQVVAETRFDARLL